MSETVLRAIDGFGPREWPAEPATCLDCESLAECDFRHGGIVRCSAVTTSGPNKGNRCLNEVSHSTPIGMRCWPKCWHDGQTCWNHGAIMWAECNPGAMFKEGRHGRYP